jgi:hypothetical protein
VLALLYQLPEDVDFGLEFPKVDLALPLRPAPYSPDGPAEPAYFVVLECIDESGHEGEDALCHCLCIRHSNLSCLSDEA